MTETKTCSIEDCARTAVTRTYCNAHYKRWRRHGDPLAGRSRHASPEEAFRANAQPHPSGCVLWHGYVTEGGYGRIWDGDTTAYAHRYAWERENGPVPDGMVIDHACHVRSCVNVSHLRLATNQQNSWNRQGANPNSTTGLRGVTHDRDGRPLAQIKRNGRSIQVPADTEVEAAEIAAALRREHYGEFAGKE